MRLTTVAGALAGVLAAALALPAGAAELTIENLTEADIVGVSLKPGEVVDFKRVRSGTTRTLEVTMPKGECQAHLTLRFDDGGASEGSADVCRGEKVRITQVSM
jgi:hypothetical protein